MHINYTPPFPSIHLHIPSTANLISRSPLPHLLFSFSILLHILKLATFLRPLNFLPQQRNHTPRILGCKRCTPRNNHIAPCISSTLDCAGSDSAVDFDVQIGIASAQIEDFGEAGCDAFLAPETWFDGLTRSVYDVWKVREKIGRRGIY